MSVVGDLVGDVEAETDSKRSNLDKKIREWAAK